MRSSRKRSAERHLIVWGTWGPYHRARFGAYREACRAEGIDLHGLELFKVSTEYAWSTAEVPGLVSMDLGGEEASFPGVRSLRPAIAHVRRIRPSVLFLPAYHHWSLALNLMARLWGTRIVIMSETTEATARSGSLRRLARSTAVRTAGAMLVGGAPQRRYCHELGVREERVFDSCDVVDNAYFDRIASRARRAPGAVRRDLGVAGPFYLAVARLVPKKSLDTLIRAYGLMRDDDPEMASSLVIIGTGPLRAALEALAAELGIAGQGAVTFVETFDEERVASAMGVAQALVLPSVAEEWGLVVNEAMAAGCPVVVSRTAGCAEDLVEDGVTGLLFDPGDARCLATQLMALQNDPRLRERLARGARARIAGWGCDRFARGALRAARAAQAGHRHLSRVDA